MNAGTKIGIVGKTGSGKTTLIDVILGLLEPNSGYLEIDHKVLDSNAAWQNKIGYVPQDILNDTTIAENIAWCPQKPN